MIQIKTQLVIVFFNQLAVKCKTCNMNEKRDGKVLFRGRWTAHHIYIYIYMGSRSNSMVESWEAGRIR